MHLKTSTHSLHLPAGNLSASFNTPLMPSWESLPGVVALLQRSFVLKLTKTSLDTLLWTLGRGPTFPPFQANWWLLTQSRFFEAQTSRQWAGTGVVALPPSRWRFVWLDAYWAGKLKVCKWVSCCNWMVVLSSMRERSKTLSKFRYGFHTMYLDLLLEICWNWGAPATAPAIL